MPANEGWRAGFYRIELIRQELLPCVLCFFKVIVTRDVADIFALSCWSMMTVAESPVMSGPFVIT